VGRVEIHIPADVRQEIWNAEKARSFGEGREEEDKEDAGIADAAGSKGKGKGRVSEEARLSEVRLRSERVPSQGDYMLGIMHDERLHLHPISEVHQFRPSMTYLDVVNRRTTSRRRGAGSDSESEGPPPDPDLEPLLVPPSKEREKKEKEKERSLKEAREVQVTTRRSEGGASSSGGSTQISFPGGLSGTRREMLLQMREEAESRWENLKWCDVESPESSEAFDSLLASSAREEDLVCRNSLLHSLDSIKGL
jgi:DNA-directed RNA polymerase-3 subunit RPC5